MKQQKHFTAHFWFVAWDCISLGFHVCLSKPNIEIHIPFGFIRIGWTETSYKSINHDQINWRYFGTKEKFLDE